MNKRILIVEDDPRSLFALQSVLEQQGYEVVAQADGGNAASIDAQALHAALIDLRLPAMSGAELARQLREKNPEIRVIFMTAYAPEANDRELKDATILVKPLKLEEILQLLHGKGTVQALG